MLSMTRPCLSSLLLAIFYCCANAKRAGRETEILGALSHVQENFLDITDELGDLQSGYKCCCDMQSKNDGGRGINADDRANYCVIAKVSTCYHVKVTESTPSAHSHHKVGSGRCLIAHSGLSGFLGALNDGVKSGYCRSFPAYDVELDQKKMNVDLAAAAFNEQVEAPCPDGSKGTATCLEGTLSYGKWSAVRCNDAPTWCPTLHPSSDGLPTIQAAKVGTTVFVHCPSGKEAKPRSVKCTGSGFEQAMCYAT